MFVLISQPTYNIQWFLKADHAWRVAWYIKTRHHLPLIGWWVIHLTCVIDKNSANFFISLHSTCYIDFAIHGCSKCIMPCLIHRCNLLTFTVLRINLQYFGWSNNLMNVAFSSTYYIEVLPISHTTGSPALKLFMSNKISPFTLGRIKITNETIKCEGL